MTPKRCRRLASTSVLSDEYRRSRSPRSAPSPDRCCPPAWQASRNRPLPAGAPSAPSACAPMCIRRDDAIGAGAAQLALGILGLRAPDDEEVRARARGRSGRHRRSRRRCRRPRSARGRARCAALRSASSRLASASTASMPALERLLHAFRIALDEDEGNLLLAELVSDDRCRYGRSRRR